ncbi:unnamed protein product [Didymodactylos carnosus]|uniref:Uncharacterized protein n=1 Tax=Didymodactylos carnosus TaxID=1234261 RepID=A0A813TM28_9BILA|nr:unnamed protein product [Didymodactylos carnosus]CAF0811641.1 unnamed protein product [Didymodactylos carnosus]CAF3527337.1 unnamed protein product [Didymodactylos carnosus]CAF3597294.1 unnamed protein product [Didymodactylos carnosus]
MHNPLGYPRESPGSPQKCLLTFQKYIFGSNMDIHKRVQSAYPSRKRQPSSVILDSNLENYKHRSITSGDGYSQTLNTLNSPYKTLFDNDAFKTLESPYTTSRRPKTGSITSSRTNTSTLANRKLRLDEIEHLLRSLDRDDSYIVQVECLANYRTLCQTINLRKTPLDSQLLCALQKRENKIVQYNACRDTRFISLIDSLQPPQTIVSDEIQSTETRTLSIST